MKLGSAAALAAAALVTACGGTTAISEIAGPEAVRCQASVAAPGTVPHSGSSLNLTIVAERECAWSARSETDWARVEPSAGQGQATVIVNVAANPNAISRSGSILVNDTRLSLTQEAAPCTFQLGDSSAQISFAGGRVTVPVSTPSGCTWRARSDSQAWARVATDSGTGSGTVEIEVAPNTGGERSAIITVENQSFTLVQLARTAGPPAPGGPGSPSQCSVTLDASDRTFAAAGGEGSIRVTAPAGCAWTASADAPWIEVLAAGATGTGDVRYRVAANTGTSTRTGSIAVSGRTYTVRQEGASSGGGGGNGGGGGGGGGNDPRVDLSGQALFVEGSCPGISFLVDLRRVYTTSATNFRSGSCSDIRFGTTVRVEGREESDGRVRATDVRIR